MSSERPLRSEMLLTYESFSLDCSLVLHRHCRSTCDMPPRHEPPLQDGSIVARALSSRPASSSYRGYRFPFEIIAHCTWMYFRFCLSFRDVQEMMLERGIEVLHEAIRLWTLKFGGEYARRLRRQGRSGDMWYLERYFLRSTASRSTCGGR